jgi:hypothetical protein
MKRFQAFMREGVSKGEDYETVIVNAWNCKQAGKKSCKGTGAVPIAVGRKIVDSLGSYGIRKGKAARLGDASLDVTPEWAQYFPNGSVPSGTKTPKTDIMIGDARMSVKMGVGQLMSAGKSESTATFYAALAKTKGTASGMAAKIEEQIKALAGSTKAKNPGPLEPQIAGKKDRLINRAEKAHKELMASLREVFANDAGLAVAFVHEAMSGDVKFGSNSPARAHFILSTNTDGSAVKVYNIDDAAYCAAVARKVRVQVRFKSTSEKTSAGKTGYYRYWSVVSLIMGKVDEEFSKAGTRLNESILQSIWSKITEFVGRIWSTIKGWLSASWKNLIEFLGLEPDVSFNNSVTF